MTLNAKIIKGEAELAHELCEMIDEAMCGDLKGRADAEGGNARVLALVIAKLAGEYLHERDLMPED
jgi:hypothetical protein